PVRGRFDARSSRMYYIYINVMETSWSRRSRPKARQQFQKAIRDHLSLKPGDRVKFFVHPAGSVVLLPKIPASALRGIVKPRRQRPVTIEEMSAAAAAGAAGVPPARPRS